MYKRQILNYPFDFETGKEIYHEKTQKAYGALARAHTAFRPVSYTHLVTEKTDLKAQLAEVAERIRTMREIIGLSEEEMAQRTGCLLYTSRYSVAAKRFK